MKISRQIKREIILTPAEVYAAVAAKYDLPTKPDEVWFDLDVSCSSQIRLVAKENFEQDYADDA